MKIRDKRASQVFGAEIIGYMKTKGLSDPSGTYGWVNIIGDSMTMEGHPNSIPEGSKVLVKNIPIKDEFDIPRQTPVVLINGRGSAICKIVSFVFSSPFGSKVRCSSINRSHKSGWVPLRDIHNIFLVEQILRPNTKEPVKIVPYDYEFTH